MTRAGVWLALIVVLVVAVGVTWRVSLAPSEEPWTALRHEASAVKERVLAPIFAPTPSAQDSAIYRDPLSVGADLKQAYEAGAESSDPTKRAIAGRAWSLCLPGFLGPKGLPASPDALAASFPKGPMASARLESMRALATRCAGFFATRGPELMALTSKNTERFRSGYFSSRAEQARTALLAGNRSAAENLIREALRSRDPSELKDLAGLVTLWNREGEADPRDAVRDAALAMVGCDLGIDCDQNSLLALDLCAMHGACEGDVAARLMLDYNDIDHEAISAERRKLALEMLSGDFSMQSYFRN